MTRLEVVAAGPTTTLQDGGRRGVARFGVPRSGPVDVLSHRLAVRLTGVAADDVARTVAIEVGPHPCRVVAHGGDVGLAVAGSHAEVEVEGERLAAPCVVTLRPGEGCTVHATTWAYLVPAASVDVPAVLGSRSRHPRSGLGPALDVGTHLALAGVRRVRAGTYPTPRMPTGPLRVLAAPQTQAFTAAARTALVEEAFETTTTVDRMGLRLAGPPLVARAGHDIVSDGIVAGSVQVPGDGQPYVLLADHQTTGGYPKIAVLASVDLARLVRLPPGRQVRFAWTDVARARAGLRTAVAAIEDAVGAVPLPHARTLGRANLISGVTDPVDDDGT